MIPVAIAFAAIFAESVWLSRRGLPFDKLEASFSVVLGLMNLMSQIFFQPLTIFFILIAGEYTFTTIDWSLGAVLICFVLNDFVGYWTHRFAHATGWGWIDHIAHHTDRQFNFSTSLRLGCLGPLTPVVLAPIPLIVLGFPPEMIFAVHAGGSVYQFFLHTEMGDPFPKSLAYVFNTPTHHRVHHASNAELLDCNFGGVLILWDRFFGTFKSADGITIRYGTSDNFGSRNPFRIAIEPALMWFIEVLRNLLRPKKLVDLAFGPPRNFWSSESRH